MTNGSDRWGRIKALADKPYAHDLFGIQLLEVGEGAVTLALPHRMLLGHRPGAFQGAIVSALGEYAAAWSAVTRTTPEQDTMTIEQSIRFVGPAQGERLIAVGRVMSAGRTISVTAADIFVEESGSRRLCAFMSQTNRHVGSDSASATARLVEDEILQS